APPARQVGGRRRRGARPEHRNREVPRRTRPRSPARTALGRTGRMTGRTSIDEVDEGWVAHLRDLSAGVEPPTSANPHAMSRTAIRRTRTRRAVLSTGGGVLTVAAVAGAAFALGGPTTTGELLPG